MLHLFIGISMRKGHHNLGKI